MFNPVRALGHELLGALFIGGGLNQLKDPGGYPSMATDKALSSYGLADRGLPPTKTLVTANGAGMVAAGAALALGILPRTSALALAALMVPTTIAGHPFWQFDDPQEKFQQRNEFMTNLAVVGGLLAVATTKK